MWNEREQVENDSWFIYQLDWSEKKFNAAVLWLRTCTCSSTESTWTAGNPDAGIDGLCRKCELTTNDTTLQQWIALNDRWKGNFRDEPKTQIPGCLSSNTLLP